MWPLTFTGPASAQPVILCLGAHSDDIEIGCGATILKLAREWPDASFHWIVLSANGAREKEARASAQLFLKGAGKQAVQVEHFRDGYFPSQSGEIKEFFEELKLTVYPDLIFTHFRDDRHQDHRLVSDLTWNTFRNHLILEYEIPKYDGDLGQPNFFYPADSRDAEQKIDYMLKAFTSQQNRSWFTRDTFLALMRLRGIECSSTTGLAEAFHCRKACIGEI